MTEAELCKEHNDWCAQEGKEPGCALEMVMFDNTLTPAQREHLEGFCERWDDMLIDQEARRAVEAA